MTNCPNCGTVAQPGAPRCIHCNYKWPQVPPAPETAHRVSCWNCQHPNVPQQTRCEACNVYLNHSQAPGESAAPKQPLPAAPSTRSCVVVPLVHPFTLSYVQ